MQRIAVVLVLLLLGCTEKRTEPSRSGSPLGSSARTILKPSPSVAALLTAGPPPDAPALSRESEEPPEAQAAKKPVRFGKHRLVLDELVDVAPAGPSAATPVGVLLLARDATAYVATLHPGMPHAATATKTPVDPLDIESSRLVALERGPRVSGGYAYFVHGDHLVSKKLPNGELVSLASDARAYTRVAVPDLPLPDAPAVVAYVARHPTERSTLIARLWVEGSEAVTLTPDGSAANSVTLVRAGNGYIALSLESRTGMSPLHARRIVFDGSHARLGSDVVPYVAGTAQPLTEVYAIGDPTSVWALLPMERDATRFGLARVSIGLSPRMGAEVHWREYPNGVEPAVVASGYLCDRPVVLYGRPANDQPHATQELHLAAIGPDGLGPSLVIGTSRAFADASIATLDGGALVVYVADRRTWARRLRCLP